MLVRKIRTSQEKSYESILVAVKPVSLIIKESKYHHAACNAINIVLGIITVYQNWRHN